MNNIKDVQGYEGLYSITSKGVVYNAAGLALKCAVVKDGVHKIGLSKFGVKKKFAIHRLVAIHFIPNPKDLPQVDHIDGDKSNNAMENLRWCTNQENQDFRVAQGNEGSYNPSKQVKWGDTVYSSIGELARVIATARGSKEATVRKEIKAAKYGTSIKYGKICEFL